MDRVNTSSSFSKIDELVQHGISTGIFPGATYAIGKEGKIIHLTAAGRHMYCPDSTADDIDTIWDMASCSKVMGCTPAAMVLFDEGKLKLDEPVAKVLPAFGQNGKDKITPRNLLLHDSGLEADLPNVESHNTAESFMDGVYASKLAYPTGTKTVYSDLSMITLGKMMEKITGQSLDVFVKERIFEPIGMTETMYCVPAKLRPRCAPTEPVDEWRKKLRAMRHEKFVPIPGCHPDAHLYIQGEVHDPSAEVLNGVSGNAGVFSTCPDVCKYTRMMLDEGMANGKRIIKAETIRDWTRRQNDIGSRGLGWDTSHGPYSQFASAFSRKSFGHTGFTGTSIWADPETKVYGILLSNRVYPTAENNKIIHFRRLFYDAVAEVVRA
jgi:CubicO group peptidase (beta-lactamase class C family)